MISMLNHLSKSDDNVTITKSEFEYRVDKLADLLSNPDKDALLKEKRKILECVTSGTTVFDIDKPGTGPSDGISLTIKITSEGGRRSKTRRTKKGTRKGTKRRGKGHRRS